MSGFNEAQALAISHESGPMLVLAGPGSGKTTVIVERTKHLIEQVKVSSKHILVITFTRASAKEMKKRFEQKISGTACTFGTFHSVFFNILKSAYGYTANSILPEEKKYSIIKEILKDMEITYEDEEEMMSSIIGEIGLLKSEMIDVNHYYASSLGEEEFRMLYQRYQDTVVSMGKLDFDDMLVYCYELLNQREDILKGWQNHYQYILVDEFQDINKIQYEIVKLLAAPCNNLFVVGDDDQSIYRFRGAKPEIMLGFEKDFPAAVRTILNTNYRSSKDIVKAAGTVIQNNKSRFTKDINSIHDYMAPVVLHPMKTQKEQFTHILNMIQKYHEAGVPFREMAVIFRINIQARGILNTLMEYNVPFKVRDNVPCLYDHFIAKNILDYIRAATGNRERSVMLQILNKPKRYLSRELLTEEQVDFAEMIRLTERKAWAARNIEKLESDLNILKNMKPYAGIHFIRKGIGYDDYIKEYAEYRHLQEADLYQILDELEEASKEHKNFFDWFSYIDEYKTRFHEMTKEKGMEHEDRVTLTTMHSAKGLEYQSVFIIDVNEGSTPYKKAVKETEIEEERRLFYVAMTRAKQYLHIYTLDSLYQKKAEKSRFLEGL